MRITHALALTTALLATSACYVEIDGDGPDAWTGSLTLRYAFDDMTCEQAGLDRIALRLEGRRTQDVYTESVDCARFVDGILFEDLREDTYSVQIEGIDAMGNTIYALEDGAVVDVEAFIDQEYFYEVPAIGADLTVQWIFAGAGACGDVDALQVKLIDPEGYIYDDATCPCDFGGLTYEGIREGLWNISLDGLSASGRVLYRSPAQNIAIIPDAHNNYTIDLDFRQ